MNTMSETQLDEGGVSMISSGFSGGKKNTYRDL